MREACSNTELHLHTSIQWGGWHQNLCVEKEYNTRLAAVAELSYHHITTGEAGRGEWPAEGLLGKATSDARAERFHVLCLLP